MQPNSNDLTGLPVRYAVGSAELLSRMPSAPTREPFDEAVTEFLNAVSRKLLSDRAAKGFPDVVTLAFWMRRASVEGLRRRFSGSDSSVVKLGRGVAFHIAPSNVPVNYAYSLVAGLLCGNKNVVRIPSRDFEQVDLINGAIRSTLREQPEMEPYICLVRYGHDAGVNDALSAMADVRIVWGGDATIRELRRSALRPRATEVTFADRTSLAVIDAETYLAAADKAGIARDFYNDTYLTDQNACTAPRAVVWLGEHIDEAKEQFWSELHRLLDGRYALSGVQAVNKLTSAFLLACAADGVKKHRSDDNLIVRMQVPALTAELMELKDNSGYFFEYDCRDIMELRDFCNDTRCQTITCLGDTERLRPLVKSGVAGIDRIVPMGTSMDFDLLWDGYDLFERLTRTVVLK